MQRLDFPRIYLDSTDFKIIMGNYASEVSKPHDSQPHINIKIAKMRSFGTFKLIFLHKHLEKAIYKIRLKEWKA